MMQNGSIKNIILDNNKCNNSSPLEYNLDINVYSESLIRKIYCKIKDKNALIKN